MQRSKRKNQWGLFIIYGYMVLPIVIFMFGWLRWYYALLFGGFILAAYVRSVVSDIVNVVDVFSKKDRKLWLAVSGISILWVLLAGIGGYCFQNYDHLYRNAIFHTLVDYDWPVISQDGSRAFIYYIGFWLPAACIGKLFNLEAGYLFQVVWAVSGILIVYGLICVYRRKANMLPLVFMIFFSGLDYVGTWLTNTGGGYLNLSTAAHLEWWAGVQFSSTTTQLFWVFNQALPAWLGVMFILVQKKCSNMFFILSLIMLTSTFPFVGLIPIVLVLCFEKVRKGESSWKELATFQNIVGIVVIGGVSFLYLVGNLSGEKIGQTDEVVTLRQLIPIVLRDAVFFYLEAGIYLQFVCLYRKKDMLLKVLAVILVICPFIKVGNGGDFCMRVSIPALFILMVFGIETLERLYKEQRKRLLILYCVILLIGAITPFNEIHRTIQETILKAGHVQNQRSEIALETELLQYENFSGVLDGNIFFQYFTKDR